MPRIPGWIIRRLSELPTAAVELPPDATAVTIRLGDGPRIHLDVVRRLDLSSREAVELVLQTEGRQQMPRPQLWAIEKLKPQERQRLAVARWSWAERQTGFLHLDMPPYFIHDAGTPPTDNPTSRHGAKAARPTKLVGLSGRCAESIVLWTEAQAVAPENSEIREMTSALLADLAAVSLPLANKVLNRLAESGTITPTRRKRRTFAWTITDPARLLDLWATEDHRTPSTTAAYVWARSPRHLLEKLRQLDSVTDEWALGGVAAANCYAPTLTADPQPKVWIPDAMSMDTALHALGGEEVTEGANLMLQQIPNDPWSLHRIRIGDPDDLERETAHPPISPIRRVLQSAHTPPPPSAAMWGLRLVSRPRAYVETYGEQRGRSAELAEHLRGTMDAGKRSMTQEPQ